MRTARFVSLVILGFLVAYSPACSRNPGADKTPAAVAAGNGGGAVPIDAELARIRATGEPLSTEEWNRWYVEPAENGAKVYQSAFEHFGPNIGKGLSLQTHLPAWAAPLSKETEGAIENFLAQNKESLALLHQAGGIKECRYPIDLTQGLRTALPHLDPIKQAARLLEMEAILAAEHGQTSQAADAIAALLQLAGSLKNEPVLYSQTTRLYCDGLGFSAVQRVLNRVQLPDPELSRLFDLFAEAENAESLARAYVGERSSRVSIYSMSPAERERSLKGLYPTLTAKDSFNDADFSFYLGTMGELIAKSRDAGIETTVTGAGLEARIAEAGGKRYSFSTMMLRRVSDFSGANSAKLASVRCAKIALAVERFRLAHQNQPPTALAELVPSLVPAAPTDLCTGKPLYYQKQSASQYEIASDSGGADSRVTFSVER